MFLNIRNFLPLDIDKHKLVQHFRRYNQHFTRLTALSKKSYKQTDEFLDNAYVIDNLLQELSLIKMFFLPAEFLLDDRPSISNRLSRI